MDCSHLILSQTLFLGQSVGVIRIPPNVSKDLVLKCLAKEDKKYNPDEAPFLLPATLTRQTLMAINPKSETLKLFHLWNNVSKIQSNQYLNLRLNSQTKV
jgi:hypothetical protein